MKNRIHTLKSLIETHEGRRNTVYDDATGKPMLRGDTLQGALTVGVGWNLSANGLPPRIINELFDLATRNAATALHDIIGHGPPNPGTPRWAALIDMVFTLGGEGFETFTRLIEAVKNEQWDSAAEAILDSKWAEEEAPERARLDAELIRTGRWPEDQQEKN